MTNKNSKIIASFLTVSVIVLLILAGPVAAFDVVLNTFSDTTPTKGATITTTATITINSAEASVEENIVELYMDNTLVCSGNVSASSLSCNSAYSVSKTASNTSTGYGYSYGYGYGYGYWQGLTNGVLTYAISIDTTNLNTGSHTINLTLNEGETNPSDSQTITVQAQSSSGRSSVTHDVSSSNLVNGYTKTLYKNDKMDFKIDGVSHELKVLNIKNKKVDIVVQSFPQYVTLSEREAQRIDLDDDGINDLLVEALSVTPYSANIRIRAIEGAILTVDTADEPESALPEQLFDIRFLLEDSEIENSDELIGITTFESFGQVPTRVNLTYSIFDESGKKIFSEEDYIIVEVEEALRKNFIGLNLPEGKYTATLETLYNNDVYDKFEQDFEIYKTSTMGIGKLAGIIITIALIAAIIISLIIYKKRVKGKR